MGVPPKRKSEKVIDSRKALADNTPVMPRRKTMTDVLKQAVRDSGQSYYAIAKATGIVEESLSRFMRGRQSLRLDKADALASYFGIECRQTRRKEE